jgi:hypothetical protein
MPEELVDSLTIMTSIANICDYQEECIKASLLANGKGILIYQPKQPLFMYSSSNDLKQFRHSVPAALNAHRAATNGVNQNLKPISA